MCGICGLCTSDSISPADRGILEAMTDALTHRGPDGSGIFAEGNVALGHRRLSIIDLKGGAQPMTHADRQTTVTFNGEIYNYVELMAEQRRAGCVFDSRSDTEVILQAYNLKGIDCVHDFNGMFAFALWDARERSLLLARDRLGEKPLFYHFDAGTGRLVFASELKALLLDSGIPRRICPAALDDYLTYGYVPSDRCIIKGVSKLAPGSRLLWKDGRITVDRYWDVSFDTNGSIDEAAWLEEFEHRVRQAIRIRLRSDVPLGIFLSGGIDSSAIVAFASQAVSEQVSTFSIGFDDADFDELSYARQVAERYGTDHHEFVVKDRDVSVLSELAYHLDEPFADPSALPTFYVCREARAHVKVCVSGDGGDELLAGYQRYAQARRHHQWDRFARFGVRQLCGLVGRCLPRHMHGSGFLRRMGSIGAEHYLAQCAKFTIDERRELLGQDAKVSVCAEPRLFAPFFAQRPSGDPVTVLQHIDQKTYLPDDILVKVDRMSMKTSLEVRVPFLDHTLIEFVNRAPVAMKLRGSISKYALKRMLRPYLPSDLLDRRKAGFGIPIKRWFRGSLDGYLRDMLLSNDTWCTRWIHEPAIRRVIDDHQRGMRDLSRKAWALLMLELWGRQFDAS